MSEHYFSVEPTAAVKTHEFEAAIAGRTYSFKASSGVFSSQHLDHATAILLSQAPLPERGEILDLGCGYGPIAIALAGSGTEVKVTAIDVNERALELTRDNATRNQLAEQITVMRPEQVPTGQCFDQIWSNPPIRIGKPALHDLLNLWLPRLAPGGRAYLVVGKNLGADSLHRWLNDQGYPASRLATDKGFRVLQVHPRGDT